MKACRWRLRGLTKSMEGDESEMMDAGEGGEGAVAQPDASPQQNSSPGDAKVS
ncbi:MAG: hypothetical protein R3E79_39460 [Caldilineaceae bacterium]